VGIFGATAVAARLIQFYSDEERRQKFASCAQRVMDGQAAGVLGGLGGSIAFLPGA
jgi:hypothetical protein